MRRVLAPVLLALSCMAMAGCGAKKAPAEPAPPAVTVANPLAANVVDWDDFLGQFVAVDSVDVRPRVSGYLRSVGFKDGDFVKKGQVLFVIDPRPYQAALDQAKGAAAHAQAALVNARAQSARGTTLLAAKAISQQAYELLVATQRQAAADVLSAQASVATAALNLAFTKVTAPLAGRVSDRRIAPGNLVTADTTVLTNIVNLDPIRFAFTGSEALYLKYARENAAGTRTSSRRAANPVEIRLQDEPTYRWRGRMDFVDNALDAASGTIRGRSVVANPDHFLTPGMFGHLRLLGSGAYPALLIPDQAVVTDQERQIVYIVTPEGLAHARPVELGPIAEGLRVVRTGLKAGDLVVIDGVQRAQAGQKVSARRGRIVAE
ncbi:MAG: efflux RND transporter periplasmic adaptor subunit, partial [Pseudomonadota bacterium]|nr:efflux RND transporter periplasmic adaptor subunit [Pseudomonadota bacterium]